MGALSGNLRGRTRFARYRRRLGRHAERAVAGQNAPSPRKAYRTVVSRTLGAIWSHMWVRRRPTRRVGRRSVPPRSPPNPQPALDRPGLRRSYLALGYPDPGSRSFRLMPLPPSPRPLRPSSRSFQPTTVRPSPPARRWFVRQPRVRRVSVLPDRRLQPCSAAHGWRTIRLSSRRQSFNQHGPKSPAAQCDPSTRLAPPDSLTQPDGPQGSQGQPHGDPHHIDQTSHQSDRESGRRIEIENVC